jgi:hypothetical protein
MEQMFRLRFNFILRFLFAPSTSTFFLLFAIALSHLKPIVAVWYIFLADDEFCGC